MHRLLFPITKTNEERESKGAREAARKLSEIIDQSSFIAIAAKIFPWERAESLAAPVLEKSRISGEARKRLFLGLGILVADARLDPKFGAGVFVQNPYWQNFCGSDCFEWKFPDAEGTFERFYERGTKAGLWTELEPTIKLCFNKAMRYTHHGDGHVIPIAEFLETWDDQALGEKFPVDIELEAPGASWSFWESLASYFVKIGWKAIWVHRGEGKPPILERLRCLPADKMSDIEEAWAGKMFADVVLVQEEDPSRGRLRLFNRGPEDPYLRLNQVLNRAKSLKEFLGNRTLQNEYFQALQMYFGAHRFPRPSYDKILEQVSELLSKIPELEDRLWKFTSDARPFKIVCELPTFGTEFSFDAFQRYFEKFCFILCPDGYNPSPQQVTKQMDLVLQRIWAFEAKNAAGKAGAGKAELYRELKADPLNQNLAGFLVRSYFYTGTAQGVFQSKDADLVLSLFQELRQFPARILDEQGYRIDTGFWASLIREQLPTMKELLAMEDVFPPIKRATRRGKEVPADRFQRAEYEFRPIRRKFNGIWRGIYWKDCAGASPEQLEQTMPERWGSILLEDSFLYYIERWGHFQGTAQLIPVVLNGKTYGSVETQWPQFFTRSDEQNTIFENWLEKMRSRIPARWNGMVVGHCLAGRPPWEQEVLKTLDCYQNGEVIGVPADVTLADPLAKKIIEISEKLGYGPKYRVAYGSNILTDATFLHPGPLIVLG